MVKKGLLAAVSLMALLAAWPAGAQAPAGNQQPVLLTADQIEHDRERNVVTALGNVEIAQQGRVLTADKVVYDMNADRVFAYGNVVLTEVTGEVFFSDQAEVTGDLRTGIAEDVKVLMTDESRMAANVARRTGGVVTELEQAGYTACQPCREKPDRPLLWELKAKQIVHDQQTHDIVFYDAWLEMLGIPVAYTPWLSTPDPTVERRSGFMAPSVGSDDDIGYTLAVPYYWALSPYEDLLFTPRFSTEQLPIIALEHRRRFSFGEIRTDASITEDEMGDIRGHIRGTGRFSINETYRAGYDLALTSDGTYLKRYDFEDSSLPFLTSRPFVEAFYNERSYLLAESYYFQGQRSSDVQGEIPFMAPLLSYSYVGLPGWQGGRFGMDANFVQLLRTDAHDSMRAYVRPYWTMPRTSSWGDTTTITAALPMVLERYSDFAGDDGDNARVLPELAVEWRYPFVRLGEKTQQVIEPIIQGVLSPHWETDDANPDAVTFDFADTNLFSLNRFGGYDGYVSGPRVNYGLRYGLYGWGSGYASAMIGQSYRMYTDDGLSGGLDENLSDLVGNLVLSPTNNIDLYYRFLLDKDDLRMHRSEVTAVLGPPALRVTADYSFIDKSVSTVTSNDREEATFAVSSKVSEHWSVSAFTRHDLTDSGGLLYNGASVQYEDECLLVAFSFLNDKTSDGDDSEGQSFVLRFVFKTLGEAPITLD